MAVSSTPWLRQLVWLRWVLGVRGMTSGGGRVAGLVAFLVMSVPGALIAALGLLLGLHLLDGLQRERLMQGALGLLYLWGLGAPLIGYAWIETHAVAPLLQYPITARQLFLGNVASALAQPTVLITLPLFFILAISPLQVLAGVVGLAAVALLLVHLLGMSQVISLLAGTLLASRRARDLGFLLATSVPVGLSLAWVIGLQRVEASGRFTLDAFLGHGAWRIVEWLPPGWAARAIGSAGAGEFGAAAVAVALLAAVALATLAVGGSVVERVALSEEGSDSAGTGQATGRLWGAERLRDPVFEALLHKELLLLWRDPRMRMALSGTLFTVALLVVVHFFVISRDTDPALDAMLVRPVMLAGGALLLVLTQAAQLMNVFGFEGRGLQAVFATPAPRWKVLAAKNLAQVSVMAALDGVGLLTLGLVFGRVGVALLIWCVVVVVLVLLAACGNVVSVLLPFPLMGLRRRSARPTPAWRAFLTELLKLVAFSALAVVALPPAIVIIGLWAWSPPVAVGMAALAVLYGAALYTVGLAGGSALLRARETAVAQAVGRAEG